MTPVGPISELMYVLVTTALSVVTSELLRMTEVGQPIWTESTIYLK